MRVDGSIEYLVYRDSETGLRSAAICLLDTRDESEREIVRLPEDFDGSLDFGFLDDFDGDERPDIFVSHGTSGKTAHRVIQVVSSISGELLFHRSRSIDPDYPNEKTCALVHSQGLQGGRGRIAISDPFGVNALGERVGKIEWYEMAGEDPVLTVSGDREGMWFGADMKLVGDCDGDGVEDLIVGSPSAYSDGGRPSGAIYLLSGASGAILDVYVSWESLEGFGSILYAFAALANRRAAEIVTVAPERTTRLTGKSDRGECLIAVDTFHIDGTQLVRSARQSLQHPSEVPGRTRFVLDCVVSNDGDGRPALVFISNENGRLTARHLSILGESIKWIAPSNEDANFFPISVQTGFSNGATRAHAIFGFSFDHDSKPVRTGGLYSDKLELIKRLP